MLSTTQKNNVNTLVAKLISGDYNQARSALKEQVGTEERYCCLGVAAEGVLGREFIPDAGRDPGCRGFHYEDETGAYGLISMTATDAQAFGFDKKVSEVENKVLRGLIAPLWLPLSPDEIVLGHTRQSMLMKLNDAPTTFNNIATVILALGWNWR